MHSISSFWGPWDVWLGRYPGKNANRYKSRPVFPTVQTSFHDWWKVWIHRDHEVPTLELKGKQQHRHGAPALLSSETQHGHVKQLLSAQLHPRHTQHQHFQGACTQCGWLCAFSRFDGELQHSTGLNQMTKTHLAQKKLFSSRREKELAIIHKYWK